MKRKSDSSFVNSKPNVWAIRQKLEAPLSLSTVTIVRHSLSFGLSRSFNRIVVVRIPFRELIVWFRKTRT
jgi:hypothetical protein